MSALEASERQAIREADERARKLAQTCFDRPLVLEAGAGTGKTTVLVARVVAWCLGEGWCRAASLLTGSGEPAPERIARTVLEGVVAITFTEAAAAEMEQRIGRALRALAQGESALGLIEESLPEDADDRRQRARALLGEYDRLAVRTIHGFCRRLLDEFPLEAGVHPRLEVDARGLSRSRAVRETLERRLRELAEREDPALLALLERDVGAPELEALAVALLAEGVSAEAFGSEPLAEERVRGFVARLLRALDGFVRASEGRLHGLARSTGAGVCDAAARSLALAGGTLPGDAESLDSLLASLRPLWSDTVFKRLREWSRGEVNKTEASELGDATNRVVEAAIALVPPLRHARDLDADLLLRLHRVLAPLLQEAEALLRAEGALSFDALLREADKLLSSRADVASRVRCRIDQLLVDEFQDTDRLQCRIVARLALEGPPAERATLFLVGDPKQSIYGWRNAELRAYEEFVARVRAEGGEVERLSLNRRSVPALLDEVERAIAPVMIESRGLQPRFEPLLPSEERVSAGREDGGPAVQYWDSGRWDRETREPVKTLASEATALEASSLASELVKLRREEAVQWSRIGILLRSTGDLDHYLDALRRAQIPYTVDRDRAYYRRREVIEAAALTRAVLDPNDQIALVGTLRSAWVGVPDAAWQPLWQRGFPERMRRAFEGDADAQAELWRVVAEVAEAVSMARPPGIERLPDWELSLLHALEVLLELRRSFDEESVDVFLEKLRTLPLLEATEASRYLGAWRLANLDRFFRELADTFERASGDLATVLRALRRDASRDPEIEEGRPQDPSEDAVQVMTIHRAKGLDFEHVYLMQLHKGSSGRETAPVVAEDLNGALEFRLQVGGVAVASLGFDRVQQRREETEEAELVRTLYVATTRARRRLVLAGQIGGSVRRGSYAGLIVRSRGAAQADCEARVRSGEQSWADDLHGVRWVFPSLTVPEETLPLEPSPRALGSDAEIETDAERLRELRALADERASRRLGAPASSASHATLREALAADSEEQPRRAPTRSEPGARVASTVGTAVHQLLERFDWANEPAAEWQRQRAWLKGALARRMPPALRSRALERAEALLEALAESELWHRLRELAPHVVARELPLLVQPSEGVSEWAAEPAPVGYIAGAIDLLYRDPDDQQLVVADFKTDRVSDASELATRVDAYRAQGAIYTRAVQRALDLPRLPPFELWFLAAGAVERIDATRLAPA